MTKQRLEIFHCEDINWKSVEALLAEMDGQEAPPLANYPRLNLNDIAIITDHTHSCEKCRQKLTEISKRHHLDDLIVQRRIV